MSLQSVAFLSETTPTFASDKDSHFLIPSSHWASWLDLIPDRKPLSSITLFSHAATILGGTNFLRRFIFDSGSVEVVLGYAVTLYREPLKDADLGATEHSWDGHESYLPLRRRVEQGKEKLTYYICTLPDRLLASLYELAETRACAHEVISCFCRQLRSIDSRPTSQSFITRATRQPCRTIRSKRSRSCTTRDRRIQPPSSTSLRRMVGCARVRAHRSTASN